MNTIKSNLENGIYVVDADYRLIHFNQALKRSYPALQCGDLCYEALCKEKSPCENCPLSAANSKSAIFYNKVIKRWVEVNTGTIEWPGTGLCHILFCKAIHEGNKNLLYNLTSISAYDELFELNISSDTYRILYHLEDKYTIPPETGRLSDMLPDITDHMIHPEDRSAFIEFWTLDNMVPRLMEGTDKTLKGCFRKKKRNGDWCWVLQTVVPVRYRDNDDLIIMCFIQDIHEQKLKELQLQSEKSFRNAAMDPLTGLYKRSVFFETAQAFLNQAANGDYCLMAVDIEHFKLFNEWFGQDAGDQFLVNIGEHLMKVQDENAGIAGYIGDDDFGIILPNDPDILNRLQKQITNYVKQYGDHAGFLPAFGIYAIEDRTLPVRIMYDRASIALDSIKGNYARRVCWYDSKMMKRMEETHKLLPDVQRALINQEFTFYAQPKCNMATGKIVGLEALIRWNHPSRGLIAPGEFIPLLESNGFITDLDLYLWDKVCRSVRKWIDSGHRPVPISVNVSRVDIYTINVVECFKNLIDKYQLLPEYIEIEITESAYVEEYQAITRVVEDLRKAGFTVLMDDFGSGFSSLNMLKDVNVDVLKIDMKFLEMNDQSVGKGLGILEAITSMARLLGMRLIAEGVETKEQMDFLLDIGCVYGQGYYFYTPMPIEIFEPLLADETNIDFRGITARQMEWFHLKELMNENLFSETMINNILGGIAFYDVFNDQIELVRVNKQYYKITGTNPVDLEEGRKTILNTIYKSDHSIALDIFHRAYQNRITGAEGDIRRLKDDGATIWLHLRAFFMKEQDNHLLFYGVVSDATEQKRREQQLQASQQALSAVIHLADTDEPFMKLTEENRRTASSIFAQMTPGGMIGGYCEPDFPLYFANYEMIKLLGYDTYEEFSEAIDGKVIHTIHPDDREQVALDIGPEYYAGLEYTTTYRMPRKDGRWFWTLDKGKVVEAEDGRLAIISACTDISETMMAQQQLTERNAMLVRQNEELNFLNKYMPGGYHRCAKTSDFDFIYMSNRFLEIFGYTRKEIHDLFGDKYLNMVHPDDRQIVIQGVGALEKNSDTDTMEYRMLGRNGYIWVIDQSRYLEYGGFVFIQGVVLDITETVNLRNNMQMLVENTPENILLISLKDNNFSFKVIANGLYRSLGYSIKAYEELLYSRKHEKDIHPSDLERLKSHIHKTFLNKVDFHDIIQQYLPDGQNHWLDLDARYIKDDTDGITYMFTFKDITSIMQKEQQLWLAQKQLESILRQAGINSWDWDFQKHTLTVYNTTIYEKLAEACRILGERHTVIENFPECYLDDRSTNAKFKDFLQHFSENIQTDNNLNSFSYELPVEVGGNKAVWIKTEFELIRDSENHPVKAVGYYLDITRQKGEETKRRENMKALELLREQAIYDFKVSLTSNSFLLDKDTSLWQDETGCTEHNDYEKAMAYLQSHLVLPPFKEAFLRFTNKSRLLELYQSGVKMESFDYQRTYKGIPRWMRMVIHLVHFEDCPEIYAYFFIMDIDDQKKQELHLTRMAETDALTGLYNRRTAIPKIKEYLKTMKTGESAALIMMDLDNFKLANDVFGHAYGDTLITQTAKKLKGFFRENDILCRIGGDEFLILCRHINNSDIHEKLRDVTTSMNISYKHSGQEFLFSTSAGYAMAPEQGQEFEDLYHKADVALFSAKMNGKNSFMQYHAEMKEVRCELADRD